MSKQPNKNLTVRVSRAAGIVMRKQGMITYPELFIEMGILDRRDLEKWNRRQIPYLECVIQSNLTKLARIQTALHQYTREYSLQRSVRGAQKNTRYSKTGHPLVEEEYRACYGHFEKKKEVDQTAIRDSATAGTTTTKELEI